MALEHVRTGAYRQLKKAHKRMKINHLPSKVMLILRRPIWTPTSTAISSGSRALYRVCTPSMCAISQSCPKLQTAEQQRPSAFQIIQIILLQLRTHHIPYRPTHQIITKWAFAFSVFAELTLGHLRCLSDRCTTIVSYYGIRRSRVSLKYWIAEDFNSVLLYKV